MAPLFSFEHTTTTSRRAASASDPYGFGPLMHELLRDALEHDNRARFGTRRPEDSAARR